MPPDDVEGYRMAWDELTQFMRQGRSHSGNERNCCYLNTGKTVFADVSAATHLDLIDDGRAVALCDWDQDGDLDVWLVNRTAPQVRFLRNDMPKGNHFLDVRLAGDPQKNCSRDAIGARVELYLSGATTRKRIKTLSAGDGFVSQSSKWIHFGLGQEEAIERLVVRWPGSRQPEEFTGLEVDRRYRIRQGTGRAIPWSPPQRKLALHPTVLDIPAATEEARVVLLQPSSTLRLEYVDLGGESRSLDKLSKGPILLNLWARSCQPCLVELRAMAQHEQELQRVGLTVLAMNIEPLSDLNEFQPADAKQLLGELAFNFPAGVASQELLDALQRFSDNYIYVQNPLPIPCSFLLDENRQVAVIYKGPVDIDQLVSDVHSLENRPTRREETNSLFPGQWTLDHFATDLKSIARVYVEDGYPELAISELRKLLPSESDRPGPTNDPQSRDRNRRLADIHRMIGDLYRFQRQHAQAAKSYQQSLRFGPDDHRAHVALAAVQVDQGSDEQAAEHLMAALNIAPTDPSALTQLGLLRAKSWQTEAAIRLYQRAIEADQGYWPAANYLAWIRGAHPDANFRDGAEAVRLATQACQATRYENPVVLDTLAVAYAESEDFLSAVRTAEKAKKLARDSGQTALIEPLRKRLRLYRDNRPYRESPNEGVMFPDR